MPPLDLPAFISYWRAMRGRTLRVLDALPEGDLEWAPRAGGWSFGDLFRHLGGIERHLWAENVLGGPGSYPGHGPELGAGLDGVRSYMARCHRETLEIIGSLGEADLARDCTTAGGTPLAVWKALRAMVEHEAHHRGQLYLMAALRGHRVAPLFGMTEEEVVARSAPQR